MSTVRTTTRRRELRSPRTMGPSWWSKLLRREVGWAAAYLAIFTLVGGALTLLANRHPRFHEGQPLERSVVARVKFTAVNEEETKKARSLARESTPNVYVPNEDFLKDVRKKLVALGQIGYDPGSADFAALQPQHVEQLQLTAAVHQSLRQSLTQTGLEGWNSRVDRFVDSLSAIAVLRPERFKAEQDLDKRSAQMVIVRPAGEIRREFLQVHNAAEVTPRLRDELARAAKVFEGDALAQHVTAIVLKHLDRTVIYDDAQTRARRDAAEAAVRPVVDIYDADQVLIPAGRTITKQHLGLIQGEQAALQAQLGLGGRVLVQAGTMGVALLLAIGLWGYVWAYKERIVENPMRGLAITVLLLGGQVLAVTLTELEPRFSFAYAAFAILTTATVLSIAYDQRFAVAVGAIDTVLLAVTLQIPVSLALVLLTGVAVVVCLVPDVRTRSTLVWAGLWTGLSMAGVVWLVGIVDRPIYLPGVIRAIAQDAMLAFAAACVTGLFVQGMLPGVEKLFRVTTSMKLMELSDASHPLLRRLVQEAPGTYQHSLRIADMAAVAADAISANALLCRVGAMYHDVGKANKPEYFIENQAGGPNRHEKLSPAMSLLIIVGHVKDGIEMAREYRLPRDVMHFIESHHGTTLVEYFYHAARKRCNETDAPVPEEFEFRYPGPKPQSKEAAIVMLCDAVEGAARCLDDPTPARLEQLVHQMATKRLGDGQFDECHLTLQELHKIESAVIRVLCAMYHARVRYPGDREARPQMLVG